MRQHYQSQSFADRSLGLLAAGDAQAALAAADSGAAIARASGIEPLVQLNERYAGRALLALGRFADALPRLDEAHSISVKRQLKSQESWLQHERSEALAALGRDREAYEALRDSVAIERGFQREEAARRIEFRKARLQIDAARRETEVMDRVVAAILPQSIARRMKAGESNIAEEVADVSVLFADIVGFTAMTRLGRRRSTVALLDGIFSAVRRDRRRATDSRRSRRSATPTWQSAARAGAQSPTTRCVIAIGARHAGGDRGGRTTEDEPAGLASASA